MGATIYVDIDSAITSGEGESLKTLEIEAHDIREYIYE